MNFITRVFISISTGVLGILSILISVPTCHAYNFCSKRNARTIFTPRQIVTDQTLELALTNYFIYHTEDPARRDVYVTATPFYQQTTHGRDFGRYFMPQHKSSITLQDCSGNKTRLSICPERHVAGALLHARIDLHWFRHGSWLSINIAPVQIEHKLRARYKATNSNCDKNYTVATLPTSNKIQNHKFTRRALCDSGIDDILVKFGFNVCRNRYGHFDLYTLFTIPTGRRCKNRSFFEPQAGNTHGSGGLGANADYTLWQDCKQQLVWMGDLYYRFIYADNERRTFDFCREGEWSRFLPVTTLDGNHKKRAGHQPALNKLSTCVRVEPRSNVDLWTALHYVYNNYHLEAGYELWWRESERVYLRNNCDVRKDRVFAQCKTTGKLTKGPLTDCDLNLCSGTVPRSLTHKLYIASSYMFGLCGRPALAGLGGSYEFAKHHGADGAPEQWTIFAKLGIGF